MVAALTRNLYGGAFTEPGGIDANVLAFTPTIAIQLLGLVLALCPGRTAAA